MRLAWRELLPNHAHDSICGCSRDEVHEQMRGRFDAAEELSDATTARTKFSLPKGVGGVGCWRDTRETISAARAPKCQP